jgi:hypothetical protein
MVTVKSLNSLELTSWLIQHNSWWDIAKSTKKLGVVDTMPKRQKNFEDLEGTDAGFSFSSHWALEHAETTRWPQTRSSFPNSGYLMLCDVICYLEGRGIIWSSLNVVWSQVEINENHVNMSQGKKHVADGSPSSLRASGHGLQMPHEKT